MFKLQVMLTLSISLEINAMNVGFISGADPLGLDEVISLHARRSKHGPIFPMSIISKGDPLDLDEVINLNARRSKHGSLFPKSRILENVKIDSDEPRGADYRRKNDFSIHMNGVTYDDNECEESVCEMVCEEKYDYNDGACADSEWCICFN